MNLQKEPTKRRLRILTFIDQYTTEHHRPPTFREIAPAAGLNTPSAAAYQVGKLEQLNFVNHDPGVTRSVTLTNKAAAVLGKVVGALQDASNLLYLHVSGDIVAGTPVELGNDNFNTYDEDETIALDSSILPRTGRSSLFALRVRGNSMIDALVQDRDVVILQKVDDLREVRNGDMVAAWLRLEQEMTLKRYHLEGKIVRLQPANPEYEPIVTPAANVVVQGKVILVQRQTT